MDISLSDDSHSISNTSGNSKNKVSKSQIDKEIDNSEEGSHKSHCHQSHESTVSSGDENEAQLKDPATVIKEIL